MKLAWTQAGLRSLRAVRNYIASDNPVAARAVADQIEESVERLATFPRSGRLGLEMGTRELVIPGLPFYVVYRITDAEVQLLKVFHSKQNRN
jgi:toxin ParE1/3/4